MNTIYKEEKTGILQQQPIDIEKDFMAKILKPYREHATYLKSASLVSYSTPETYQDKNFLIKAVGTFSIPESCYIDDTGHFNSVEFNICYNQLAYVTFAYCIKEDIISKVFPQWLEKVKLDYNQFLEKQLSSMLIVKIDGKFLKPLDAKHFYGEISIEKFVISGRAKFAYTDVKYFDEEGVKSTGSVLLAFNNNP